jgi:hypothetical protein
MMLLMDWLCMWSLPVEPLDFDVAVSLMARKFEQLCEDSDWRLYAIGKWPDEVLDLSPELYERLTMLQQIEHFKDQGVTAAEMDKLPSEQTKRARTSRPEPAEQLW